ncbi:hypothetical protein CAOG_001311 [Capsaspora owczarzaki ATCC 30864]|uniref:Cytochrome b-c1 complex subunit 6 n=1 Tax=Capsaspora owczarzaki (strain ATCC 30864) TaxID=595528 RepID=A0A0D2VIU4_CAPO3|nr:hypothetical protein CAOG_001311 [Capsaspora owczarzaki ATCC 30864]
MCPKEEEEAQEEQEEFKDPKTAIDEKCAETAHCAHARKELEECTQRVEGNPDTKETCAQELFDFWHCVDHCAANQLFAKLK